MDPSNQTTRTAEYARLSDAALAAGIARGERDAFRFLMTRCNQRLFRIARGMVASDHEAEDVVQECYVIAFEKLGEFRSEASLLTWMTRIVINEAKQRSRNRKATVDLEALDERPAASGQVIPFPARMSGEDPVAGAARAEMRHLLEAAIDTLPAPFRVVYVMREIEECTVDETASSLGLRPETVKTRLHRARRMLRAALEQRVSASLKDAFQFLGVRCARITERVLQRLEARMAAAAGG
jgi:RNA polymerase sigma factor (sigma-70 family)